ncbi:MAG: NAD(P)-binding domain-containing protein, partial [Alphaproteobacteria bacterium]|nr:NAD(P)-binding domain-containing protein [Alphaproteobacteria bacterium]
MTMKTHNTIVVGGGQAGLAASEHLSNQGVDHLVLERDRIAEKWRTARWDNLVANGPAWHDRFPTMKINGVGDDGFASKDQMAVYFEEFAEQISAPIKCGVTVNAVSRLDEGGFLLETSEGAMMAENVIAATGPFQIPVFPKIIPEDSGVRQIHSCYYRNPQSLD